MKYNELQVLSNKPRKRVGRGIAAGQGKTAGRGTKGQGSRTGNKFGPTFMGGQGALVQRIPKYRGFRSLRVKAQTIYTGQLNDVKGTTIDPMSLYEAGLVATPYHTIKLIVRGEYSGKATVKIQSASKGAIDMLTKSGGSFEAISVPILPASNKARADRKTEIAEKRAQK
ncbi:50S ribosomal protein L15 [Candidatus Saccharibacteria bacterium]|nr:50S ribosomal protein L15 [Candidatus Saccharibacteria bacterium]NCU40881.1 50S ribosomal protein L15 [Candidatus Saccharibacteria bacterium]